MEETKEEVKRNDDYIDNRTISVYDNLIILRQLLQILIKRNMTKKQMIMY